MEGRNMPFQTEQLVTLASTHLAMPNIDRAGKSSQLVDHGQAVKHCGAS
jgi:hypothetical protein